MFQRTIKGKLVHSRTDWVLCSRHNLIHETKQEWTDHSDHCYIMCVLEVPNQQPKATHLKIPCALKTLELCDRLEQESLNIDEFYTRHHEEARKNAHMKKIRLCGIYSTPLKGNNSTPYGGLSCYRSLGCVSVW